MAISGHKSEASIRSYAQNVSEDQSRAISESLTSAASSTKAVEVYHSPKTSNLQATPLASPTLAGPSNTFYILPDLDLPTSPQLNQFVNSVLSPKMSSTGIRTEIFLGLRPRHISYLRVIFHRIPHVAGI